MDKVKTVIGITATHPSQEVAIAVAVRSPEPSERRYCARRSLLDADFLAMLLAVVFLLLALSTGSAQNWNSVQRYTSAFLGTNTADLPFSFTTNGRSSRNFLPTWNRTIQIETLDTGRQKATWRFSNAATGLSLRAEAVVYSNYPAIEWVLWFRNNGTNSTPLIQNVRAHDKVITISSNTPTTLFYNEGTYVVPPTPSRDEFKPAVTSIVPGTGWLSFGPYGGRPSDMVLPFFNVCGPDNKAGLFFGIGWTGQWSAQFQRVGSGDLTVRAGIKSMKTILYPGEEIRTPSILVMSWDGTSRDDGQNQFRRFLREYCAPRIDGKPVVPPISAGPHGVIPFEQTTETNLLECIRNISSRGVPVDNFWLDAGWYTCPTNAGGWDKTTGTWVPDPVRFPNGLRPVADAAKQNGMDFLVWFEPERVMPNTSLANEHPEWLLSPADFLSERSYQAASNFRLLDFGNPAALAWAKTFFSDFVRSNGITIFRMDCNLHPILYWQNNEPTNRVGMRETKHVMGLYDFWDSLVTNNPGLKLDVCAGTGSRVDFEVMRRAMNLTRADGAWWDPVSDQGITIGYAPWTTHTGVGSVSDDLYNFRSGMGAVFCANLNWRSTSQADWMRWKALLETVHEFRDVYAGDFYALTDWSISEDAGAAWSYQRPETGKAVVQVFRRSSNTNTNTTLYLQGMQTNQQYLIRNLDSSETMEKSGLEMMSNGLTVNLPAARSAGLWKIEPLPATNQSAGTDFWWSGKGSTNGIVEWTARGGSTNANQWSYGVADLGGGSQPASLAATSGGPTGRGAFGNFRDLSMTKTNTAFTANALWLYRSAEGAEIGFFSSAFTNQAPGFDGAGASWVTNPNSRYLWLKPGGSAGDGFAAALRYTAPKSREYRIRGEFVPGGDGSNSNNTQSFAILRSASSLDPNNRSQDAFLLPRTVVRDDGPVTPYDITVSLRAGETITWLVGTDGGNNATTGGSGNQMAVSAEVQQTLPPTLINLTGPTRFFATGGASYPSFQIIGAASPVVRSFVGVGATSYGPSPEPPAAPGNYRMTITVASDGTYGRGMLEIDFSILTQTSRAASEFWWSGANGRSDWTNATNALLQGRSPLTPTNSNNWSYGWINCTGGSSNDPYPTSIVGTQPGTFENGLSRDTWNQFWDLPRAASDMYAGVAPIWYYETNASVGWFGRAWFEGAPGYDGAGAGRNGVTADTNSNTNYLWMRAGPGANDGAAAAVRWTAPMAGTYVFKGEFLPGGFAGEGKTMSVAIVTAGAGVTNNILMPRTVLDQDGMWQAFNFTSTVTSGQTVTWLVGSDGDSFQDYMGLQAEVTAVLSPLTLSGITPSNKTYDGTIAADWTGSPLLGGKAGGDDVSLENVRIAFVSPEAGSNRPVIYTSWSLVGPNSDRYQLIAPTNQTATIFPAMLQVTADAKRKAAGQPDPALTWQATGWKGTDSASLITGSLSRATGNQLGTYAILPGTLSAGSNYTISFTPANFIVDPSFVLTLQQTTNPAGQWRDMPITTNLITPNGQLNLGAFTNTNELYRLNIQTVVE